MKSQVLSQPLLVSCSHSHDLEVCSSNPKGIKIRANLSQSSKYSRDEGEGNIYGNSWFDSMIIIIANVMGIGVLGLAHAFAKLGWIWGIVVLTISLITSVYSGLLLSKMKCKCPHVEIYADLGYEAFGNLGKTFVTIFGYSYLVGICFSFQLSASIALKELTDGLCFVYCSLTVAFIVLPLAQYRNFEEMTWVVYAGALAIVFPIIIIISEISIMGRYEDVVTVWVTEAGFDSAFVACMTVIFAITGQVIFIEIMSEMRDPREFPKSVIGASSVFFVVYNSVAILGYYYIGENVLNPITDNLTDKPSKRWCAAFVLCHIIVAYVMEVMVLARAFEHFVLKRLHEDSKHADFQDRMSWFLITFSLVLISVLVCNIVPFLNELMGFIGALSGVTTTYVFPFLFAPILLKEEMNIRTQRLHQGFATISCLVSVYGAFVSIQRMINSYETRNTFSC